MKRTKLTALVLALAMLLSAAFCLFAAAEGENPAAQADMKPEIISKNIVYKGDHALLLAISTASVTNGKDNTGVSVTVYGDANKATNYGTYDAFYYDAETDERKWDINGDKAVTAADSCFVVQTQGIGQLDMATQFYFEATDGTNTSDLYRYSVAEYFYERICSGDATEAQLAVYNNALTYGASVQTLLASENAGRPLVTDYRFVKVVGGTLQDGYTQGVYNKNTEITLTRTDDSFANWAMTNCLTGTVDITGEATFVLKAHTAIEGTNDKPAYVYGTGTYFTKYKNQSLTFDGSAALNTYPSYYFKTGSTDGASGVVTITQLKDIVAAAGKNYSDIKLWSTSVGDRPDANNYQGTGGRLYLTDNTANGVAGVEGLALTYQTWSNDNGTQKFFVFNPYKEENVTTYVFESDVCFDERNTTDVVASDNNTNVFAIKLLADEKVLAPTTSGQNADTHFIYNSMTNTIYVKLIVDENNEITGYQIGDKTISSKEWFNLRITIDSTTGAGQVFVNNEAVADFDFNEEKLTSIEGLLFVGNSSFSAGNFRTTFDNTYFGTYTD